MQMRTEKGEESHKSAWGGGKAARARLRFFWIRVGVSSLPSQHNESHQTISLTCKLKNLHVFLHRVARVAGLPRRGAGRGHAIYK